MKRTIDMVPPGWKKYVGMRPPIADPLGRAHQMAFTLITECLAAPQTPFGRIARNALYLCDETEDFIYKKNFGFLDKPYQKGARPLLEQYIAKTTKPTMSTQEKLIALSQSIEDLPRAFGNVPGFLYGESDEETLLKGGGHCSCRSRLLVALAQVMGLQGRVIMFWVVNDPKDESKLLGGHTVAEIHFDGKWNYFDPMARLYCPKRDGTLASVIEIRKDHSLLTSVPAAALRKMAPKKFHKDDTPIPEHHIYKYFQAAVPTCYSIHDVSEPHYGPWTWATDEFRKRQAHDYERNKKVLVKLAKSGGMTDRVYAMGVAEFRREFNIKDAQLEVPTAAL